MHAAIPYPFEPGDAIALDLGPLLGLPIAIRWYALAYLAGFLLGLAYAVRLARRRGFRPQSEDLEDFVTWAIFGVIIGGRLGHVLFYQPGFYFSNPLEILKIWQGGMSFHGGLIGCAVAILVFARRRGFSALALADLVACTVPIGIFLGRLANFVNGEIWGRPTSMPWGMIYPAWIHPSLADGLPRHPYQLYGAVMEGLVPLLVCGWVFLRHRDWRLRPGALAGVFCVTYAVMRFWAEFYRRYHTPPGLYFEDLLGFGISTGQIYCVPMVPLGLGLLWWALQQPPGPGPGTPEAREAAPPDGKPPGEKPPGEAPAAKAGPA